MSHCTVKKKALVGVLCLISFTVGCFLMSLLSTGQLHAIPRVAPRLNSNWDHIRSRFQADDIQRNSSLLIKNMNGVQRTTVSADPDYTTQVSKFHYFVEVDDPRADLIFRKVLSKLPSHLMKSVVVKNMLTDDRRSQQHSKASNIRDKWKVFIGAMQEKGYQQRLPTIINIGVKKSGTNALGFFLSKHPQLSHSIGNEVHYFDWNYEKGLEYYRSRMGFSTADQLSFEKTPRYFITHNAPQHIREDLPGEVKLIICIRDPVERAKSEFRHEEELSMRRDKKSKLPVQYLAKDETSASQGEKFMRTVLDAQGNVNSSNEIVDTSNYSKHFKQWLKFLPRNQFYILSDEQVNKDIYTEMKNIEKFIGLTPYFKSSMFYYDQQRHGPCMYNAPKPCPAKSTPGFLPKAEPSADVIKKLRDFYRPFNQEFQNLSQIEFSWTNL